MEYTVTTSVFVTLEVIGFHRWDDAPHDVKYLSVMHRHKFGIRVEISTHTNDREIEYHTLKRQLGVMLKDDPRYDTFLEEMNFGSESCEMIATKILDQLRAQYSGRDLYRVTVDEDGENGSTVEALLVA